LVKSNFLFLLKFILDVGDVLFGSISRYEALVFLFLSADLGQNADHLILGLDRVIFVFYRMNWRDRVAGVSSKKFFMLVRPVIYIFLLAFDQFIKNAPSAPHINFLTILRLKQNNLWRSIPSGSYMIREASFSINVLTIFLYSNFRSFFHISLRICPRILFSNRFRRFRHRSRQAKITDLDIQLMVNQDIRWLNISVDQVCSMYKIESTNQFVYYFNDILLLEDETVLFHELEQILIAKLENQKHMRKIVG
jgi:hypothetical protein